MGKLFNTESLKRTTDKTLSQGTIFVSALMVTHFFNLIFNVYLGKSLTIEQFGLVTFITSILYFTNIIFIALVTTVSHNTAYLSSSINYRAPISFYRFTRDRGFLIALVLSLIWIFFAPLLSEFFNLENPLPLILFSPIFSLGLILAVNKGFLEGRLKFARAALIIVSEPVSRLIIAFLLVASGSGSWAYIAIPLSISIAFLLSIPITGNEIEPPKLERHSQFSFPHRFFIAATLSGLATITFLSIDVIFAKHFFDPTQAGQYALLTLSGKMVFFLGALFNNFMVPLVGKDLGAGRNPNKTFYTIFSLTLVFVACGAVAFGSFGSYTIPLIFGSKTKAIISLLPAYIFAITCFTLANNIVTYHLARKQYIFPIVAILNAMGAAIGFILYHNSLEQFTWVLVVMGITNLLTVTILHFFAYLNVKSAIFSIETRLTRNLQGS